MFADTPVCVTGESSCFALVDDGVGKFRGIQIVRDRIARFYAVIDFCIRK